LNIGWSPSGSKIYLENALPLKRSAYLSGSDLARTAEVAHRTIRCLVSKPMNIVETLNVRKSDNLIRDLAQCVKRGMVLFEAISVDCRRERDPALAQVSGSPLRSTAMSKRTREEKNAKSLQLAKPDAISIGRRFAQPYGRLGS
jgi:hypothetical protein